MRAWLKRLWKKWRRLRRVKARLIEPFVHLFVSFRCGGSARRFVVEVKLSFTFRLIWMIRSSSTGTADSSDHCRRTLIITVASITGIIVVLNLLTAGGFYFYTKKNKKNDELIWVFIAPRRRSVRVVSFAFDNPEESADRPIKFAIVLTCKDSRRYFAWRSYTNEYLREPNVSIFDRCYAAYRRQLESLSDGVVEVFYGMLRACRWTFLFE